MVDYIDKAIIGILEINARSSFAAIGREIGLSTSSVRERVNRLEEIGVIKSYNIKVDYSLLGLGIKTIIIIKAHNGKLKSLSKKIMEFKEVKNVQSIMGEYNLHVVAYFKDIPHMQAFLDQLLPYGDTVTMIATDIPDQRLK